MLGFRTRPIALVALVAAAGVLGCSKAQEAENEPGSEPQVQRVQQRGATKSTSLAPDFQLRDVEGKIHKLSDYEGKVIILDFWDTWCPPCKAEIPDFVDLQKKYGAKGVQIIGVAFARYGVDAVKSFMKQYKINYPILLADAKVVQAYGGIEGIPTTFVIDKKGAIYRKYVGYRPRQVWETDINSLLAAS